jgi:hypothetical protein
MNQGQKIIAYRNLLSFFLIKKVKTHLCVLHSLTCMGFNREEEFEKIFSD